MVTTENSVETTFLQDFDTARLYWPDSEELNEQLMKLALEKEKEDPKGVKISNKGGWHSQRDAHKWGGDAINTLVGRAFTATEEMAKRLPSPGKLRILHMWANLNRNGDLNYPHQHSGHWCGFYCVSTGGSDSSGDTCLVRGPDGQDLRRLPWNMLAPPGGVEETVKHYSHPATEGALVMFPWDLLHYVNPYYGDKTRMTIAFNFEVDVEEV